MTHVSAVLAIALTLFAGASYCAEQDQQETVVVEESTAPLASTSPGTSRDSDDPIFATKEIAVPDLSHPRVFVRLYELDRKGRVRNLLSANSENASRVPSESIDAEVDARSRVIISFDRAWLEGHLGQADVDLLVKAQVKNSEGVRNIEVLGYSEVGKELSRSTASLNSVRAIRASLSELSGMWNRTFYGMRDALVESQVLSLADSVMFGSPSEVRTRVASVNQLQRSNAAVLLTRMFREEATGAALLLEKLADPANATNLEIVAALLARDPLVLSAQARELRDRLEWVSQRDSRVEATIEDMYRLLRIPELFGEVVRGVEALDPHSGGDAALVRTLLDRMKVTDILIPLTGGLPGDDIIIEVSNHDPASRHFRATRLKLRIHEFGFVRRVTDSALFLRRVGVSERDVQSQLASGAEEAEVSDEVTQRDVVEPMNYEPAPGVTLAWTYYARRSNGGLQGVLRMLQPGLGVNVSFPRYGRSLATFTPTSGTQPPTVTTVDDDGRLEVGAGIVLTIFDTALQATYGWNLSVDKQRAYFGLGFSFVRVISGAGQLVSTK